MTKNKDGLQEYVVGPEAERGYQERYLLLHTLLDMGEALIRAGAEINRVENTVMHLGKAYGASDINIFAVTTSINLTLKFEGYHDLTGTRRVLNSGNTNLGQLELLNDISRKCCKNPIPIQDLKDRIESTQKRIPLWATLFFSFLLAGSFSVLFGGTLFDALVSGVLALLIYLQQSKLQPFCPNRIVFNFLCAFFTGLVTSIVVKIIPGLNIDKIIVGDIMLLVPGIALTNSIRDMIVGDTMTGIMRMIESLLWAAALGAGFALPVLLMGG